MEPHLNPTFRPLTPTFAYVFRISPQERETVGGLSSLEEFRGAHTSIIRIYEGRRRKPVEGNSGLVPLTTG